MYTQFFGLNEKPFAITPDPRYLFMSERHGEGLAHLLYGVTDSGGFIQLTGEVRHREDNAHSIAVKPASQ